MAVDQSVVDFFGLIQDTELPRCPTTPATETAQATSLQKLLFEHDVLWTCQTDHRGVQVTVILSVFVFRSTKASDPGDLGEETF